MRRFLHELLVSQAAARPEQFAVCWKGERIPYGEVDQLTNQLAQTLRAHGCHPGDRVAVLIPNSANALFAVLGILKAGCVAMPLNLAAPTSQLSRFVDAIRPASILTARSARPILDALFAQSSLKKPTLAEISVGTLEVLPIVGERFATVYSGFDVLHQSAELAVSHATENSPALILFSSADVASEVSGVSESRVFDATLIDSISSQPTIVTHKNLLSFLERLRKSLPLSEYDRVASLPLHSPFAVSVAFAALAAGAELHMIPQELLAHPKPLAEFVRSHELTDWLTNHGLLAELLPSEAICDGDFPSLKRLLWTGQTLSAATLSGLMQRLPLTRFLRAVSPGSSKLSDQRVQSEGPADTEPIPDSRPAHAMCRPVNPRRLPNDGPSTCRNRDGEGNLAALLAQELHFTRNED